MKPQTQASIAEPVIQLENIQRDFGPVQALKSGGLCGADW